MITQTHSNVSDVRYAIYFAPARASPWWRAGCTWLGRDPETDEVLEPPQPPTLQTTVASLTRAPRRYGWHATLVPPFRLVDGATGQDLLEAAQTWARRQNRFHLPVEAALLGDFVALQPVGDQAATAARDLAVDALRSLTALRSPPSPREIERRSQAPLTQRQRTLLQAWGYPYVLDEFRFHMTLSDTIASDAAREAMIAWWRDEVARLGPLAIDGAAIFTEPTPGARFALWRRLPFGPESTP